MNNKWSNRYDRFGYVQRGYDNGQLYEQAVDMYWEWEWEQANRSKAEPKQAEPKPDRRIILALG